MAFPRNTRQIRKKWFCFNAAHTTQGEVRSRTEAGFITKRTLFPELHQKNVGKASKWRISFLHTNTTRHSSTTFQNVERSTLSYLHACELLVPRDDRETLDEPKTRCSPSVLLYETGRRRKNHRTVFRHATHYFQLTSRKAPIQANSSDYTLPDAKINILQLHFISKHGQKLFNAHPRRRTTCSDGETRDEAETQYYASIWRARHKPSRKQHRSTCSVRITYM